MANTTSAQKAMRQAERRALRNRAARSAVRTYVKKATEAVAGVGDDAAEVVRQAVRALDKAAQKGIIHRNAAARRKSRLMSRLHQLTAGAQAAAASAAEAPAAPSSGRSTTRRGASSSSSQKTTAARRTTSTRKPSSKS